MSTTSTPYLTSQATTSTLLTNATPTTSTPSPAPSEPAIQTRPFTGQALLVGTCALPQFTILTFPDGGSIEVPLIGCSDDRPDCCPSLSVTEPARAAGTESNVPSATPSPTSGTPDSTTSPTAQGVISMLSKYPLTVCPSDMVDLDPVCCPIGFSRYGQHIIGNLPCYSTLTTTIYSPDASVLASITSVVAASMASASTTTTPTISVIVNQVFALGLPCADDEEDGEHSGLSIGAKAGIGAGAGVGALLILFAIIACFMVAKRRRKKKKRQPQQQQHDPTTSSELPVPQMVAGAGSGASDGKHLSAATTMTPGSPIMFPQPQTQPHMNQCINPQYPSAMGGHPQSHGYSPAFGNSQPPPPPPPPPPMVQDQYGGMYNMQPTASQPYPYQYNSPSLATGQQSGTGMPYSPTYNPQPSAPPLQQFYPYQNQHQYQHQYQYQPQHQHQQRSILNPNSPVPVEADSGSRSSNFHPSSLSSPSQPGLSISMTTPPVSHDRNSASQPTSSVNGGPSVAELSSHGGSTQSQRPLINRKSVPG